MTTELTLPASQAMTQRFRREEIELIKQTICKGSTDTELKFFLAICNRTRLDPFLKQIYWSKFAEYDPDTKTKIERPVIMIGIDGYRAMAEDTGKYAGQTAPQWCGDDLKWVDVWLSKDPPAACRVGILRTDFAEPIWGIASLASYAKYRDGKLTGKWREMPDAMLAVRAEMNGLRKAFPKQISFSDSISVDGNAVDGETGEVLNVQALPPPPPPPPPPIRNEPPKKTEAEVNAEFVAKFSKHGVTQEKLEILLERSLSDWTRADRNVLRVIHDQLKSGEKTVAELFDKANSDASSTL